MPPTARRSLVFVVVLLLLGFLAQPFHSPAASASAPAAAHGCKIVKKGGKKHRVCKTGHPAPTPTPTTTPPPPSYDTQARDLIGSYLAATTDDGRLRALEDIMQALHVTVYGPDAKPVVQGAGTASDPFLIDLELRDLAAAQQAGETSTLDSLAHDLAVVGVRTATADPLTAGALGAAVEAGIAQAATRPAEPTSLAPLLIRELGLHHQPSIDLASSVPVSEVTLDPVQRYLLSADILIPWALGRPTGYSAAHSGAEGDRVSRQSGLSWLFGGGPYPPSPVEQAVQQLLPGAPPPSLQSVSDWLTAQWLKTVHFDIHPQIDEPLASHYGPAHEGDEGLGGHVITFKLHATLPNSGPRWSIDCAAELALLHAAGLCNLDTLSQTAVSWDLSSIQPYANTFDPDPSGLIVGSFAPVEGNEATVLYYPKNELLPGVGVEKTATGVVTASPHLAQRIGGLDPGLGAMLDAEYANQQFPWKVSYHQPRGFKFSVHEQWHFSAPHFSQTTDDYITAHVCGSNPFGVAWTWKDHDVVTNNVDDATSDDFTDPTVPLEFDTVSVGNKPGNGHVNDLGFGIFVWSGIPFGGHVNPGNSTAQGDVIFDISPPAMLRINITNVQNAHATGFTIDTTSQHLAVPIEEDTSCPDPGP